MRISSLSQYALGVTAAVAILAGCGGGSRLSPDLSTGLQRSVAPAVHSSWMAPDAKKKDLLYISNLGNNTITAYSWPKGKLKGTLTGFTGVQGLCSDKNGDIFITNQIYGASQILKYAHGGTSPIATLSDAGYYPSGCSVDPKTGNLAVANVYRGNLGIYQHATGSPTYYTDSNIYYGLYSYFFCGYDDNGNVYVDGTNDGSGGFEFAELPSGSSAFTDITLNQHIGFPGGVQWDGKHIAVGDQYGQAIYQFTISGSKGTEIGSTLLTGSGDVVQFWKQGPKVVGPDQSNSDVGFWNYPAGGSSTKTITNGIDVPVGATVSKRKK
ncbi:MAG: hypothetical protein WCE97_01475 [Candidatus Cybelea sp.]